MRFYGLGFQETLALPARTFWMLHKNIDRLSAEEGLRLIETGVSTQSGEMAQKLAADLRQQMGVVVEIDAVETALKMEFDRDGLNALKGLGKVV